MLLSLAQWSKPVQYGTQTSGKYTSNYIYSIISYTRCFKTKPPEGLFTLQCSNTDFSNPYFYSRWITSDADVVFTAPQTPGRILQGLAKTNHNHYRLRTEEHVSL
jgi:hypothetical protein